MFNHELSWDDSGTDSQSPIVVAACYVAKKTQWDEFVRNWDEARKEEGFDVFHMADFMAKPEYGKNPFCEWDEAKKKRVYFRCEADRRHARPEAHPGKPKSKRKR